jgi:8-oxo-dGTP pyrophosphatase MutT (NUDIX family)
VDLGGLAPYPLTLAIVTPGSIAADPRPAATVVLLRDSAAGPEVFLVRRHEGTPFMGGAHVFPGGRVDAADHDGDATWSDGDASAYHVAAARELFEEAGVLLARGANGQFVSLSDAPTQERFKGYRHAVHDGATSLRAIIDAEGLRLAADALVFFSHWVTPPIDTRQFDTHFFITRVPPEQTPVHDDTETTHSTWLSPASAIAQARDGLIVLPPPTWTTLRELERFGAVDAALDWARRRRVVRRQPLLIEERGSRLLVMPGDPLHPEKEGAEPGIETRFVSLDRRWRAEHAGA